MGTDRSRLPVQAPPLAASKMSHKASHAGVALCLASSSGTQTARCHLCPCGCHWVKMLFNPCRQQQLVSSHLIFLDLTAYNQPLLTYPQLHGQCYPRWPKMKLFHHMTKVHVLSKEQRSCIIFVLLCLQEDVVCHTISQTKTKKKLKLLVLWLTILFATLFFLWLFSRVVRPQAKKDAVVLSL